MATAEQMKSLIRAHFSENPERFFTIALQVAAHEAQQGHGALAHDIRLIVDNARKEQGATILQFPKDMLGMVLAEEPSTPKAALIIPDYLENRIDRIIHEYMQQQQLKSHGLTHRRKILLVGPPGTGKTMTAQVLAHELRISLYTIQVDRLVTKFMGETSAKLRQIFDLIQQEIGVYLFDEFDAIGGERNLDNDVGEMRRVLNSFLQFIEQDKSDSLVIAATNSPKLLDKALFRRFDDILYYENPTVEDRQRLIKNILTSYLAPKFSWKDILQESEGLSQSEIDQACRDSIKETILNSTTLVKPTLLKQMLKERQNIPLDRKGE